MPEDFVAGGTRHVTFIVRLARDSSGHVTGVVERVKTGEKIRVAAVEEVAQVLDRWLASEEDEDSP